jgi:hypothetical protein
MKKKLIIFLAMLCFTLATGIQVKQNLSDPIITAVNQSNSSNSSTSLNNTHSN